MDDERATELLLRHRPVLRYDRQYDYRAASALGAVENRGNLLRRFDGEVIARAGDDPELSLELLAGAYPPGLSPSAEDCIAMAPDTLGDARRMEGEERYAGRLYGQAREDGGKTWLQYWIWLYYNPKNLFGFGQHEGDWEMIQVGLGEDDEPEVVVYSQHAGGEARPYDDGVEFAEDENGDPHPVAYVASLSHACYFEPGTHVYVPSVDHAYGDGPTELLPVELPGDWVHWKGHWGRTHRTLSRRQDNGPQSPGRQGKWERPAAFHAKLGRRPVRRWLGRALHRLGRATFPPPPVIAASRDGRVCKVAYELGGSGRHLYLTVHEGERVLASRALSKPPHTGEAQLLLPAGAAPDAVCASAFNRLRQRSDLTEASL